MSKNTGASVRDDREGSGEEGLKREEQSGMRGIRPVGSTNTKNQGDLPGGTELGGEGEKEEAGGGVDVMKKLDQNRMNQMQELLDGRSKGRTWKRRENTCKKRQGIGAENLGCNVSTNGKRGFSLINEDEIMMTTRRTEKKLKMEMDEMQVCQTLVDVASHNWPQPDQ